MLVKLRGVKRGREDGRYFDRPRDTRVREGRRRCITTSSASVLSFRVKYGSYLLLGLGIRPIIVVFFVLRTLVHRHFLEHWLWRLPHHDFPLIHGRQVPIYVIAGVEHISSASGTQDLPHAGL